MGEPKEGRPPSLFPRQVGRVSVISLQGAIDATVARTLEPELRALAESEGPRLAIGLGSVQSIDSSGLGMLLALTKRARASGGDVVLFEVPASVESVLRVTGMRRVIRTFDAESQAVSSLDE